MTMLLRILVIFVAGLGLGYVVLISPDNPLMRAMRGQISDLQADVIIGPYPVERDLRMLKQAGVATIVSLLDPNFPYEKQLLEKEQALAREAGLQFFNFPMGSVVGHKLGAYYDGNARAAAAAIDAAVGKGKVYVHCYLGVHRVVAVRQLLEQRHTALTRQVLPAAARTPAAKAQDHAEALFNQGQYALARQFMEQHTFLTPPLQVLYAWTLYRMNDVVGARRRFAALSAPELNAERELGLAYCDYREQRLRQAEQGFRAVLARQPDNAAALTGLGLSLQRLGQASEALPILLRAQRASPGDTDVAAALRSLQGVAAAASAAQVSRP